MDEKTKIAKDLREKGFCLLSYSIEHDLAIALIDTDGVQVFFYKLSSGLQIMGNNPFDANQWLINNYKTLKTLGFTD